MKRRLEALYEALPIKAIDRYLMRQFLVAYAICAFAVIGLFVVLESLSHLDNFLRQEDALPVVVIRYFAATVPVYFTQYLGPILTLMGAMFAITSLNKGSEITPLKAAGLSVQRILAPFFVMALACGLVMIFIQELVIPSLKDQIRQAEEYSDRSAGIRNIEVPDALGWLITVREYFPQKKLGMEIEVKRRPSHPGERTVIQARSIEWHDGQWILFNGNIQRWDEEGRRIRNPGQTGREVYSQRFQKRALETDMRPVDLEATDRDIPYLSHRELSYQIKRRGHLKHLEVKLHRRYAFPLANVILLLLGLPLVLRGENRSIVIGIGFAIAIAAFYLLTDMICADLGNKGALPASLCAWLPVLFFGALGLTLYDGIES